MGSRNTSRRAALAWGVLMIVAGCALPSAEKPELEIVQKARPAPPTGPQHAAPALLMGEEHRLYVVWASKVPGQKAVDGHLSRSDDGGRTWLRPPISLEAGRPDGPPQLFSDPDGTLHAFYALGLRTPNRKVVVRRSQDGGATWSASVVIRSGNTLHRPLFLHRPGLWYVLIPEGTGELNWKLEVHRSTDGGSHWEQLPTPEHAFTPTGNGFRDFDARLDPQGRLHLVWAESNQMDLAPIVFYNRLTPGPGGAAWLPRPIQIGEGKPASRGAMRPKIEFGGDRELTAIWEDQVDPKEAPPPSGAPLFSPLKIKAGHSRDDGATWSAPLLLNAAGMEPFLSGGSTLASDGGRHLYAAWVEGDSDRLVRLKFSRSDDGGATWQDAEGLRYEADPDTRLVASLKLTADAAGHVTLLWQQIEGDGWKLLFNRSADYGRTWMSAPYQLVRSPQASKKMHWVDMQAKANRVWVAFDGGPGPNSDIYLVRSQDFGATWSAREVQISR